MKAIIMAGGAGTRLKSVTGDLPKPMVPLLGRPLMERIVALLRSCGITEICAALKYAPESIVSHFGDGSSFGVKMEYRLEKEALGTAGGVKNCADFYGDEPFLVISGDAACDFDLAALIRAHEERRPAVSMALYESDEPLQYGLVLPDSAGRVRAFIEKPDWSRVVTDLVNTGIYVISPAAMELVPAGAVFDFARDLFPLLLRRGDEIAAAVMEGYWCDVGTPRAYYRCCLDALEGRLRLWDEAPESTPAKTAASPPPLPGKEKFCLSVPCAHRAALMRRVSESLMEAGADYSCGVTISGEHCALRISPAAEEPALRVEAASDDGAFTRELASQGEALLRELEG